MPEAVIVSATRTPIARFQGAFSSLGAAQLGALAVKEAVARAGIDPELVDEVLMGCVLQAGLGQNPARQAAIHGGIPVSVPAMTVNKVCGSGLKSIMLAAQAIKAGDAEVIVAGGMESMTNAPYLLPGARAGQRLGHGKLLDSMVHDGLWDCHNDFHMGHTGEAVAEKYEITREEQDAFAAESHRRAVAAQSAGKFDAEIVPVSVPQRKGDPIVVLRDEGPRADTTVEGLAKLRPAFQKDGTVTAANASSINDGASAVVVMSAERAAKEGIRPLARITGYAASGVEPKWVMMAPVGAVRALNEKLGVGIDHFDQLEINEPFAVASIAVNRELGTDPGKTNVNGGAVALGHPIGATGARMVTTLLYALADRGGKTGLASLCLGGGNAVALSLETL
jgi:acetyl-CoA C-acetyltransferase